MARSNKPLVWGPFAAGGVLTALVTPALVLLTLLAGLGHVPEALGYDAARAIARHWAAKIAIPLGVFLSLWSAAHRLRVTLYDLGVRADVWVAALLYCAAAAATAAAVRFLLAL